MNGFESLTDRVIVAEFEFQSIGLILVERIVIQHPDIHLPFLEITSRGYADPWRQMFVDLFRM